jgi:hypothetical protein
LPQDSDSSRAFDRLMPPEVAMRGDSHLHLKRLYGLHNAAQAINDI